MPTHEYGSQIERYTKKIREGEPGYLDIGAFLKDIAPEQEGMDLEIPSQDHLPPSLRAEIMWALYKDIQRAAGIGKPEQLQERYKEKSQKDGRLAEKTAIVRKLWADKKTKETFQREYARHIQEEAEVNGEHEKYTLLRRKILSLQLRFDEITTELFTSRGENDDELAKIMYDSLKRQISEKQEEMRGLLKEHPELAARAAYEQLKDYRRQLHREHFVWLPSRRRVLEQLGEKMLTGRPIMIMSESGAGKSSIVKAAARRFTGDSAAYAVGGPHVRAEKLFVTRELEADRSYYRYQPLLEAMTGKDSDQEKEPHHRGRFFLDDEFNQRPPEVQMEVVKALSGGVQPGERFQVPNVNVRDEVQPGFAYIAAGNPPSERYHRQETDVAVEREFAGNILPLDYLEQTAENPELFQLMIASLMDQNGRIRVAKEELAPAFVKDAGTGEWAYDSSTNAGGFLWRFANGWHELFDAFQHKETMLAKSNPSQPKDAAYLDSSPLDVGAVISWIQQYQKIGRGKSLEQFIKDKLNDYLAQPTISKNDKEVVKKHLKLYGIDLEQAYIPPLSKGGLGGVLTPQDVGLLMPFVPRPREKAKPPVFETKIIMTENGDEIEFYEAAPEGLALGGELRLIEGSPPGLPEGRLIGRTGDGEAVITDDGVGYVVPMSELVLHYIWIESASPVSEPQPEPTPELPETLQETYEKAERLFKENFIGITQVETAFTIEDENGNLVKLIELSPQEQQEATRLLKEKLEEPDIRVFLKKLESKELNPEDYLLVLRVPTLNSPPLQGGARGGSAGTRTGGRIPLTMQSLNQRLQPDLTAKQQGKLLYDTDWYEKEQFYTTQQPGNTETDPQKIQQTNGTGKLHWQITTKTVIPDSTSKDHTEQTPIIQQAATQASLDPAKTRRRTPVETTYDWLTTLRKDPNNQERILTRFDRWDWSDVRSSDGRLVDVGDGGSDGLSMLCHLPEHRHPLLGVSLSR